MSKCNSYFKKMHKKILNLCFLFLKDIASNFKLFFLGISSSLGKGSTNLHLDVSDSVNILAHVSVPRDGKEELATGKPIYLTFLINSNKYFIF